MTKRSPTPNAVEAAAERHVAALKADDPEATQALAEVDTTQPLDHRHGDSNVPALRELDDMVGKAINDNLRTLAGVVEWQHAETQRRTRADADKEAIVDGTSLLAEAFTHLREVEHVPDELKRRFLDLARTWAPNGDGTP